ncbi:hypothetical protein [Sinorhizobium meliloti]|uniref:hypothetical protein n=1 Tax=Rhizobium meliloti TaxID=382 RepID=UPI0013157060|nr:hypothetical protein [Sinorhizobium meliloti]
MLDFYFSYRGVLKRLRSGALGGEMDRLAEHFFTVGYKRASAKIYLSRIARFSQFAATRCGLMPIHQDVIDSYLGSFYCGYSAHRGSIGSGTRTASGSGTIHYFRSK